MELAPGTKLGPYEILAPIGAGGMGAVYRARDSRLGRDVAIKVSAAQFTERFEREARAVAALNHPHICTLHDIGPNYLVMEYIEGQPPRTPLPADDAIRYAIHIADALDAAHVKGIIHRDIKPANVMITARGEAKVLDFGLAQFQTTRDSETELMLTAAGSAVGTVAYMSPEQARGQPVDGRTDIWALGVMLYEMVTGARPFQGATQASIFDAIMNRAVVAPSLLNPDVPPDLEHAILKAIQKDRSVRYQSAAEMLADLRRIQRDAITASAPVATKPSRPSVRYLAAGAVALVAIAAAVFLIAHPATKPAAERSEWKQLTNFTDSVTDPVLSPDGRMLAFKRGGSWWIDSGEIYVKMLPDGQAIQLTHDGLGKFSPAFSPDGSRIVYSVSGAGWNTWEVPVLAGGEPRRMLANAEGLQWIDPRHILFSEIKSAPHMAVVVSEESRAGIRDVYIPPHENGMAHFSSLSPDRKQVLVVEMDGGWIRCRLVPFDGSSKGMQVGPPSGECTAAAWSPDGKWMYFTANTGTGEHLWRQGSDGGAPEQITSGPTTEQGIAVSPDGRSIISSVGTASYSVWVHDANGDRQVSSEGSAAGPRFSPDGTRVFYLSGLANASGSSSYRGSELWAADLNSGRTEPVLRGILMTGYVVSPDGKAVAWQTGEGPTGDGGLWYATLDQRTPPRNLVKSGVLRVGGIGSSGDVFFRARDGQGYHSYVIARDGTGLRQIAENLRMFPGGISPDGQWAISEAGERDDSVLSAYPLAGGSAVTLCSGCVFMWSPDGKSVVVTQNTNGRFPDVTGVIPLPGNAMLPRLPADGLQSPADLKKFPGVQMIPYTFASPGPAGSYAYTKSEILRNLYRIPLP